MSGLVTTGEKNPSSFPDEPGWTWLHAVGEEIDVGFRR